MRQMRLMENMVSVTHISPMAPSCPITLTAPIIPMTPNCPMTSTAPIAPMTPITN